MDEVENVEMDVEVSEMQAKQETQTQLKIFLDKVLKNVNDANIRLAVNKLSNPELRRIYIELYNTDILTLPKLKAAVIYSCLRTLLHKWTGYYNTGSATVDTNKVYQQLVDYLINNLKYVNSIYHESEVKCLKHDTDINSKPLVELSCPYRQLKSIVYFDSTVNSSSVINKQLVPKPSKPRSSEINLVRDIFNIPHIEIKIACPSFIISKQNYHKSEYKFVRLTPDYKPKITRLDTKLKYSRASKMPSDIFPISFIMDFLDQFNQSVQNDIEYSGSKKDDILNILSEFKHELKRCTNEIECGTEYYAYSHKYPYVRYLGQKDANSQPAMTHGSQTELNEDTLNLRLQEIIYPAVQFTLAKFNVAFTCDDAGKYKFEFSSEFVAMILNKYLIFKCNLCHVEKVGQMAKHEIATHIYEEHGEEPNWYCLKCKTEFQMSDLCSQRWSHACPYIINKKSNKKAKMSSDIKDPNVV